MRTTIVSAFLLYINVQLCNNVAAITKNKTFLRGTMNSFSDFEELIKCTTFVDKTLLVPEFFKNTGYRQFHLITCPHKFGKTTNLNMLKRFLTGNADQQNGLYVRKHDPTTYQLFHNKSRNLKIASSKDHDFKEHFQGHAVIHISFKNVHGNTLENILNGIRDSMKACFEMYHSFLETLHEKYAAHERKKRSDSDDTSGSSSYHTDDSYGTDTDGSSDRGTDDDDDDDDEEHDESHHSSEHGETTIPSGHTPKKPPQITAILKKQIKVAKRILDGEATEDDLTNGLLDLANLLSKFYPYSNVFLLIDDYDDPIINAIEHNLDVTRITTLIEKIFSKLFLSHHPSIRYALVTGTLNVLNKVKFSHVKHWNFLDHHHFTKYFGFTGDEVDDLLNHHLVKPNDKLVVKQYYNGYSVASSLTKLFNPFSMANYLCHRNPNNAHQMLENHWAETTKIPNFLNTFKKNEEFGAVVEKLLNMKHITFKLKKVWQHKDLQELKEITHDHATSLTARRVDIVLSYLFHNGYLSHGDKSKTYTVPNEEIRSGLNHTCTYADESDILDGDDLHAKLSP